VHFVHVAPDMKYPRAQTGQESEEAMEYLPIEHSEHIPAPLAANVPGTQSVHPVLPAAEDLPGAQGEILVAPPRMAVVLSALSG